MSRVLRNTAFSALLFFSLNSWVFAADTVLQETTAPGSILKYNAEPWYSPKANPDTMAPSNRAPNANPPSIPEPVQLEESTKTEYLKSDSKVLIKDIQIDGMTLLSDSQVHKILQPYKDQLLTFGKVQELAEHLTDLYIQAGYVNSRVYIPPQNLEGHILHLHAMEVKIGHVILHDPRWYSPFSIRAQIAVRPGQALNINPLRRNLQLIDDNPDLKVIARLEKGERPGTSNIILDSQSHFPIHMVPFYDDLGRSTIGKQRGGVSITHNNLLNLGDMDTASVNFTQSSFGLFNQYLLPVGPYGTRLGFDFAYSRVRLNGSLKALDIQSHSQIFSPHLQQVLWKNEHFGLISDVAFDFKNLNTDIRKAPLSRDRLRVLRPNLKGYWSDRYGRGYFNQEFGIGLPILGGTDGRGTLASKANSGSHFFRMAGSVTRIQKLPFGTTGVLRSGYQYSPDRLLSAEQMQVGGAFTVRGYSEGREIGDSGYFFNAEWYVPALFLPSKLELPFVHKPLKNMIQFVAFSDYGRSFTNRPKVGEVHHSNLASVGGGVRVQLTRFVIGRFDVGFPLIHQEAYHKNGAHFHFGLQSALF